MTAEARPVLKNPMPLYVVGLFSMGYVDFYIFLMPLYCLSLGMSAGEVGLICRVHPDGPAAHIERQRTLLRAGWHLLDAFASRWSANERLAAPTLAPFLVDQGSLTHLDRFKSPKLP